jgi:hypothetical protein
MDVTSTYRQHLANAPALRAALTARYSGTPFVLVRGFLTDLLDSAGVMMREQISAVTGIGGHPSKPELDAESAPAVNALAIAAEIRHVSSGPGSVTLITHSKGSVDALTALVAHEDLRTHVGGWISLQGAIQGSAVADALANNPVVRPGLAAVFQHVLGGSIDALDSLRTQDRAGYLNHHVAKITAITQAIPIVSYGSAPAGRSSALRDGTRPFFRDEPENDGLMAIDRTAIPGARWSVCDVPGPDHADAVVGVPGQSWDRVAMTHALLRLLA